MFLARDLCYVYLMRFVCSLFFSVHIPRKCGLLVVEKLLNGGLNPLFKQCEKTKNCKSQVSLESFENGLSFGGSQF